MTSTVDQTNPDCPACFGTGQVHAGKSDPEPCRLCAPDPATDARMTWGLIIDLLDVLERHGYHRADSRHTGQAVGLILPMVRAYTGEDA
jgi:hypothetical protein